MTEIDSYRTRQNISGVIATIFAFLTWLASRSYSIEGMLLFFIPFLIFVLITIHYGKKVKQLKQ
jgi:Ca2+/Na+ antiporter